MPPRERGQDSIRHQLGYPLYLFPGQDAARAAPYIFGALRDTIDRYTQVKMIVLARKRDRDESQEGSTYTPARFAGG